MVLILFLQQCDVITSHVELKVGKYYGAMNVDGWNLNRWEEETKQNDVSLLFTCFLSIVFGQVDALQ